MNEDELIEKIKNGDENSFRFLFDKFQSRVYNTALSYLQNQTDAEDITQEVFIEVFRSVQSFKGDSSLATWLYRITINKCNDLSRHRKRKKRFAFLTSLFDKDSGELKHDSPHFEHPGIQLEKKEDAAILFSVIDTLPENQKTAFLLAQVEELSQKEIADVMQISVKAVESLIQRAKVNLREKLKKH